MAEVLQSLSQLGDVAKPAQPEAPVHVKKVDAQGRAYATGKRKNAIARVWIKPGSGKVTVNGRDQEIYFARPVLRLVLAQPLQLVPGQLAQGLEREGQEGGHVQLAGAVVGVEAVVLRAVPVGVDLAPLAQELARKAAALQVKVEHFT